MNPLCLEEENFIGGGGLLKTIQTQWSILANLLSIDSLVSFLEISRALDLVDLDGYTNGS